MARKYGLSAAELGQLREVTVPSRLREQFSGIARLTARESCAALYGGIQDSTLAIGDWRSLTNHANSEDHFLVAVDELLRPLAHPAGPNSVAADRTGAPVALPQERLVGLLHTHPHAPSHPSETDRIGIAQLPFVWVIVGAGPEGITDLRSFTWSTDGIRELPTRIAPDACSSAAASNARKPTGA